MNTSWLDFLPPFFQGLLVATGVGFIIGLEREHDQQAKTSHFAGLRTFPLIAILGFSVGFISDHYLPWLLPAYLLRFKLGVLPLLGGCAAAGLVATLLFPAVR